MSASFGPVSFDLAKVEAALAGGPFAGAIEHVTVTESTNTLARAAAEEGRRTGVWIADEQTQGRGRGGHGWHSAPNDGLYVSVLLRPRLCGVDALKLSLAAGIAVQDAIDLATNALVDLRWPNDVMDGPHGKKLGGILTECAMEAGDPGALAYAVIGIGLNLNQTRMPEDLRETAISLRMSTWQVTVEREDLLPILLRELLNQVNLLEREAAGELEVGEELLVRRFEQCSSWARGLRVQVAEDEGYAGVTDGLDERGLLRVRLDDGSVRLVRHGGVRRG